MCAYTHAFVKARLLAVACPCLPRGDRRAQDVNNNLMTGWGAEWDLIGSGSPQEKGGNGLIS